VFGGVGGACLCSFLVVGVGAVLLGFVAFSFFFLGGVGVDVVFCSLGGCGFFFFLCL